MNMKKLLFAVALMVSACFASCGNCTKAGADTDSVAVDTCVCDSCDSACVCDSACSCDTVGFKTADDIAWE